MSKSHTQRFDYLAVFAWLLCLQPLFVLVFKGWSSGTLIIGGLACLIILSTPQKTTFSNAPNAHSQGWEYSAFIFANSALFISVAVTGLIRQDLHATNLDSPARFLLSIPIFIFLRKVSANVVQGLLLCITLGLIFTLANQTFCPSPAPWDKNRMSNSFADPLAFGYITLSFSLMALTSLVHSKPRLNSLLVMTIAAIFGGLYMNSMTASRTGWLAAPLVLLFLLYMKRMWLNVRTIFTVLGILVSISILAYGTSETVHTRIDAAVNDVADYSFMGIAPDTSVGMRITFLRMAADMIAERPMSGYGDTQVKSPEIPAIVKTYASPFAISFALNSGFHNEVVTNTIQYGLPAGFAALVLFLLPLAIYWKNLNNPLKSNQLASTLGVTFTLTYFISSLSTEVFGLKYTASLYAMMTAVLCAGATRPEPTTL